MDSSFNGSRIPVTVIIPAYNAEHFIGEALQSVQSQTVKPAEIIVIDDGSNDQTVAIAKGHQVKVLYQHNKGPSAARNAGILAASQEWVAFLDADDIWESCKLERQWAAIQACPDVAMVFADLSQFNAKGTFEKSYLSQRANYQQVVRKGIAPGIVRCEPESLRTQFHKGNFIITSTLLVRRETFFAIGLFDESINCCEDRELCLRIFAVSTAAVVEQPLMHWRFHDDSWSTDTLRAALGAALVTERVLDNPEKYSSDVVEHYEKARASIYLNAGRWAEEYGEIRKARDYYVRSWRSKGGIRSLSLAILSCFPLRMRLLVRATVHQFINTKFPKNPAERRTA